MTRNRVLIVTFDALRPDMVTPELMPNLTRFAAEGAFFPEAGSTRRL
jgi:phosphonoacetate hydrolase